MQNFPPLALRAFVDAVLASPKNRPAAVETLLAQPEEDVLPMLLWTSLGRDDVILNAWRQLPDVPAISNHEFYRKRPPSLAASLVFKPKTPAGIGAVDGFVGEPLSLHAAKIDLLLRVASRSQAVGQAIANTLPHLKAPDALEALADALCECDLPLLAFEAACAPSLNHWHPPVRAGLRAGIAARGGTPPVEVLPAFGDDVVRMMFIKGARLPAAPVENVKLFPTYEVRTKAGWEPGWTGKDPLGKVLALPAAVAWFEATRWTRPLGLMSPWKLPFEFNGASSGVDWRDGPRRVLHVIGMDDHHRQYALDLLKPAADPVVWRLEHDGGSPPQKLDRLSLFLERWLTRLP